jgi:exosortase A-associated hydrolase 2
MLERPQFLDVAGSRRFAVFHPASSPPRAAWVFCHAFGEEKLWTHRVQVTTARTLAASGQAVLRFDHFGHGDSEGRFEDSSVQTSLADIDAMIDHARRMAGVERVGLFGLRWGATLASLVAEAREDVAMLALWAPIISGKRYMQDLMRVNLATQMTVYKEIRQDRAALVETLRAGQVVNVDGYPLSHAYYEQATAIDLVAAPKRFARPCLMGQFDRRDDAPIQNDLQQLGLLYPKATVISVREEPFWKEIPQFYDIAPRLLEATSAWAHHVLES